MELPRSEAAARVRPPDRPGVRGCGRHEGVEPDRAQKATVSAVLDIWLENVTIDNLTFAIESAR
jgi:hypothetical protein